MAHHPLRFWLFPLGVPSGDGRTVDEVVHARMTPVFAPAADGGLGTLVGSVDGLAASVVDGTTWAVGVGSTFCALDDIDPDVDGDQWWPSTALDVGAAVEHVDGGMRLRGTLDHVLLSHELRNWPGVRLEAQ